MQDQQGFSNLIYEYLATRFWFRFYKYGDNLPSIDVLCREFCVAPLTVKAALQRLQREGFISVRHGKPTQVIFQRSPQEFEEYSLQFFAERGPAYRDLHQSTELVFLPLLVEGLRRADKSDFHQLSLMAQRSEAEDLIRFYFLILQKLGNPLVMNLFWETTLFFGLPIRRKHGDLELYDRTLTHRSLQAIVDGGLSQNSQHIQSAHQQFQMDISKVLNDWIERQTYTVSPAEQRTFEWRIYRDRPQICYSLATTILHEIHLGEYSNATFLPSYEKMAEKYQVSLSTMRRTVGLLNQLGITRTVNGRGTRVFSAGERGDEPDYDSPAIRKNLAFFLQALEVLAYTCGDVARQVLPSLTAEDREALILRLETYLQQDCCIMSLADILVRMIQCAPLKGIREILEKLYGLLLWGYPLKTSYEDTPEMKRTVRQFTQDMVVHLRANDLDNCSATLQSFLEDGLSASENYLLQLGYEKRDTRVFPSIRLLLDWRSTSTR